MHSVVVIGAGSQVQFGDFQLILEVLGALAGLGGLVAGGAAIYRARSDKEMNSSQMLALLFEKQRQLNLDLLTERDREIAELQQRLIRGDGQRGALQDQLAICVRERTVLRNQLRGLQETIDLLRRTP